MSNPLFLGIDVGTQGVRTVLMDGNGKLVAEAQRAFGTEATVTGLPQGWFEQKPEVWLETLTGCLGELLSDHDVGPRVGSISVTSTSGTLVAVDDDGQALAPAIMYNDNRSVEQAEEVQAAGEALASALGYRFKPSFALPKILWLKRHRPEVYERAAYLISPTDFVIGRLCGRFDVSDWTNMLKSGYDLLNERWPDFLSELEIDPRKLPRVVASGSVVDRVMPAVSHSFDLPETTVVCAGATDGCASQISTAAVRPGQWCTTIGTTLVVKGVSRQLTLDPEGRIYSHRHPEDWWLPGGASNTGTDSLNERFGEEIEELSAAALAHAPTGLLVYPLGKKGERFPFVAPEAEGFALNEKGEPLSDGTDRGRLFTAYLEGVAFVERLSLEMLEGLGLPVGDEVFSSGGGTRSADWLQIRADVLGRRVSKPLHPLGAVGAAVLAASRTEYASLTEAAEQMIRIASTTEPDTARAERYGEQYERFVDELKTRGYVT